MRIYIDNTGFEEDHKFALMLKHKLLQVLDTEVKVTIFDDLSDASDSDPNNELNTISEISKADIVIPVISSPYLSYTSQGIDHALNLIVDSSERFLLPVLLESVDWSDLEWVVKSKLAPESAVPFLDLPRSQYEASVSELIRDIKTIVVNVTKPSSQGHDVVGEEQQLITGGVFISHSHDDADFAELLKLRLEKAGISSWLDAQRLKIGQDWREEIDQGIVESLAVIVIMTPEARKSEYVTYEWSYAWGKGKKIFPIMLKQTQLHPRLESLQYLNFTHNPTRPWKELIDSIKNVT